MVKKSTPLSTQEREIRAAYFREWRAKNKDKVKTYNQRYWQKRAAMQGEGLKDGKETV